MEEDNQKDLQLLPTPSSAIPSRELRSTALVHWSDRPSLDLRLSIGLDPISERNSLEALRWQAAEQMRRAAREKAYVERLRELTRREMELAHSEFARARLVWERARAEVETAERMKERATNKLDSTCMEITCQSCMRRFKL